MRRILVLSDSHGNLANMVAAVKAERPDSVIFLGDGWNDASRLMQQYPELGIERVPGNCDFVVGEPMERILEIEGFRVMICHGHVYSVKMGLMRLQYAAQEKAVDVAMFGHTHRVFYDKHNGVTYLNPGSIGTAGPLSPPSYGILTLDRASGSITTDVTYME